VNVKLINKIDDPFGRDRKGYLWLFPDITDREEAWQTVGKLVSVLEKKVGVSAIELPGPYSNEKEMGDIGYKRAQNGEELVKLLPQLVKDENYVADFYVDASDNMAHVRIQLVKQGENAGILVNVSGQENMSKGVSAMIKKIIGGETQE